MARAFTKSAYQPAEPEQVDNTKCSANGCPMPAGLSHSVGGGGKWVCQTHFRVKFPMWNEATNRIRAHIQLVNLITEIRLSQNGKPFDHPGWVGSLVTAGLQEYLPCDMDRRPDGSMSMRKWQSRLEKTLFNISTKGLEEESKSHHAPSNSEQIMTRIEDYLRVHKL